MLLPPAARQEGVRVRWWQPQHDGVDHSDWALDNVLIAGSDPRAQISDTFGGVALPNHERSPADGASVRIDQPNEQEETPIGINSCFTGLFCVVFFTQKPSNGVVSLFVVSERSLVVLRGLLSAAFLQLSRWSDGVRQHRWERGVCRHPRHRS